jgi:aminoacylase
LTPISSDDPWWSALTQAFNKHQLTVKPLIFPAGTDSRFLREVGIPAIGFSPMNHHPVLLHDHNEFLNEKTFLRGIDIFEDIIANLADA